jgi:hypothetical protein
LADTKKCEVCDAVIGKDEKDCPSCKTNFEELDDTISAMERGSTVLAKRKAAREAEEKKNNPPKAPEKDKSRSPLRGLRKLVKNA